MINNPYMTNSPFGSSGLQISSPLSVARPSPTFSSPIPEAPPTGGSQPPSGYPDMSNAGLNWIPPWGTSPQTGGSQPSPVPNRYSNIMPSQPLEPPNQPSFDSRQRNIALQQLASREGWDMPIYSLAMVSPEESAARNARDTEAATNFLKEKGVQYDDSRLQDFYQIIFGKQTNNAPAAPVERDPNLQYFDSSFGGSFPAQRSVSPYLNMGGIESFFGGGGRPAPPPGMMLNPNYNPTQAMLDNVPERGSADELSRQMYIPATGGGLPAPAPNPYSNIMPSEPLQPPTSIQGNTAFGGQFQGGPMPTGPHGGYDLNGQPLTGGPVPPMLGGGQLLPGTIYQEPPQPKEPYYAGGGMMFNPATGKYERSPDAIKNPYYFDRFKDNAIGTADVKFSDQEYIRPEDLKNYEAQRIEDRKKYNEFLESIGQPPIPTDENQQEIATDLYTPKTGQFEDITQPSTGAPPVATQPPSGTTPPSSSGGGSVVDFLFEGEAPTPGSARETSRVELPSWYTEYAKDMLGRAKGIGNMPYEAFPGPRIAPFTETEKEGMRETFGAAGSYKPYLGAAGDILGTVGGKSSFGAAAPFIGEGAGFTREAAYGTGMPIAEQYFQEALMRTPTGAAAPYAEQAARMFPEAAAAYMSPYTQGVIEELGNIGLEQLQEKFLPEIGEEFIRAGQFGGSRMGEFGARALRDVQRSILGEQRKALESGYKTAADIYGTDVGRQAELARLMGTFGGQEQEFMGDVGKTLAGIRQEDLGRILQAGGQLGDFGKLAGALSSEDLNRLMDLSSRYADLGGLAQKYGLVGGEAITGVGEKERGMNQANLELAYKDFLEQRNYPKEQAEFLAKMLAGINLPETRISETITTPAQPAGDTGIEKIAGGVKGGLQIFDIIKELFGKEG